MTLCYRHPDRSAYVQCQRCSRPVCPECQIQAPVGVHCPECVEEARRRRPAQRTQFGTPVGSGRPTVTYTVIALCVVMYLLQLASPRLGLGLDVTGALAYAPAYTSDWFPSFEPWRMLTATVLHSPSSAMHILFNMMALLFVGRVIEPAVGAARYVALLLLSAFGGSVAVLFLTDPLTPTVGASGAVFGLFGALFILSRASGAETGGIVALVAVNMVVSFLVPNISWQGHLGGLVAGALCALVIARAPRGKSRRLWQWAGITGIALVLIALTAVGSTMVAFPV